MNNEYLKITKLNYEIDKKTIINDLNLAVKEGEFISIMGPSGSGKTSLLRLISGLAKQSKGTIKVNHKVIAVVTSHKNQPPIKKKLLNANNLEIAYPW